MIALIDLIRALVFLGIGGVICWCDLKKSRIPNNLLLLLFLLGIPLFLLAFSFELIQGFVSNLLIALLISFILWKMGIWSAGDAKFFSVASLYLPYLLYSTFFPSSLILVNAFLLAFFVWLLPTLIKTKGREKIETFRRTFSLSNFITTALMMFGLFFFVGKLFSFLKLGLYSGYVIGFIVVLLLLLFLQKMFKKRLFMLLLIGLCIARMILEPFSLLSIQFWIFYVASVFILLFALFLGNLSFYISYEEKYLKDLKVGDIPIGIVFEGKKEIDLEKFLKKHFGHTGMLKTGFSKEDVQKAQRIKGIGGFIVKKYINFAPLLLISTLLTIFLKSDIIMFIVALIGR
jgi:Flp pilus assembly protein protease CpaA